jgi:hypothetical protein
MPVSTPTPQPPQQLPPPDAQAAPPGQQQTLPEIRDIAPPVDVFPWPPWLVALIILVALIVLGVLVWLIVRAIRRRPLPPPLTPRAFAIRQLESLRPEVSRMAPYDFGVRVSDVLRTYIGEQYRLRATKQTSPEFLAAISHAATFSDDDRSLLARFLERSDLIKFAHIDATEEDSRELLSSAVAFVQGSRS